MPEIRANDYPQTNASYSVPPAAASSTAPGRVVRFNVVFEGCKGRDLEDGMDALAEWMADEYGMHSDEIEEHLIDAAITAAQTIRRQYGRYGTKP